MSIKNRVLEVLEQNRFDMTSGEELAQRLSVSRAAVWKSIQTLKKDGYLIHAVTNKGYQLSANNDLLSAEGIKTYLLEENKKDNIIVYKSLKSTNSEAKKMALDGAEHGSIILSEEQTAGRGRLGRTFFSPSKTGIYMSIVLRPKACITDSLLITVAAAVAVCRVVECFTDNQPKIKWVNDIFVGQRKVCGILSEATSDFESGMVEYVIVGIGLNIKTKEEEFPEELREIAGSLFPHDISRNQIVAKIANEFLSLSSNLDDPSIMKEYKEKSMIIGSYINYMIKEMSCTAKVVNINEKGNLVVQKESGEIEIIQSGEVTIRKDNNHESKSYEK